MKRIINQYLTDWITAPSRKSLLLRGARQVGKTYSVRALAGQFKHFLEINFDAEVSVRSFFEGDIDPSAICEKLAAYYATPIIPGETLLFLDEIQACPNAIRSLRYFHEKFPHLHVIGAGSLLEFALQELPSFGVGRISSLYMYPLSFLEFVDAIGGFSLAGILGKFDGTCQIDIPFHTRFLELFRMYCLIGGMPQVVENYCANHDLRLCQIIQDELLSTLQDDFAKYRSRIPHIRMVETFRSVANQTGGKFMYSRASNGEPVFQYKLALELLCMAGLVHRVYHTSAHGIPLGAGIKENRFKTIVLDVGLLQRLLGLDLSETLVLDMPSLVNRGGLAETFVGLELLSACEPHIQGQLYYWHREAKSSNAEVDYVLQKGDKILPVEVKSGNRGSMQSMRRFLEEHRSERGIRLSQENTGTIGNVTIAPVYAAGQISRSAKFGV